jgi:hypothetical protein
VLIRGTAIVMDVWLRCCPYPGRQLGGTSACSTCRLVTVVAGNSSGNASQFCYHGDGYTFLCLKKKGGSCITVPWEGVAE